MHQPTRRTFLRQSSLALGGDRPVGPPAGTPRPRQLGAGREHPRAHRVQLDARGEWGSWYLAEANGDFSANGVDSELFHGGPNTPAVSQILAGGGAESASLPTNSS